MKAAGRSMGVGAGIGVGEGNAFGAGHASGGRGAGRAGSVAGRTALGVALPLLFALVAGPAGAVSARFASGGWGFEAASLDGLPARTIDATTPFWSAGEAGTAGDLDVVLTGSTVLCVLDSTGEACRAASPAPTGAFSVLVSLTVAAPGGAGTGPFTLMLTSLVGGRGYGPDDVVIPLGAAIPAGLDTSAVPGFVFSGALTPFVRVQDRSAAPGALYDYLGWTVEDGSTVTFRYDVPGGLAGNGYPQLTANAVPLVVPEPHAALLLALGLAGLTLGSRPRPAMDR